MPTGTHQRPVCTLCSRPARDGICRRCREKAKRRHPVVDPARCGMRSRATPLDIAILTIRAERNEPLFPVPRERTFFRRLPTDCHTVHAEA